MLELFSKRAALSARMTSICKRVRDSGWTALVIATGAEASSVADSVLLDSKELKADKK